MSVSQLCQLPAIVAWNASAPPTKVPTCKPANTLGAWGGKTHTCLSEHHQDRVTDLLDYIVILFLLFPSSVGKVWFAKTFSTFSIAHRGDPKDLLLIK